MGGEGSRGVALLEGLTAEVHTRAAAQASAPRCVWRLRDRVSRGVALDEADDGAGDM